MLRSTSILIFFILISYSAQILASELSCKRDENGVFFALADEQHDEDEIARLRSIFEKKDFQNRSADSFYKIFNILILRKNSLEAKYCSTLFHLDQKWDSIFNRNTGVPAKKLTHKEIRILSNEEIRPVRFYSDYSSRGRVINVSADGKKPFSDPDFKNVLAAKELSRGEQNGIEGIHSLQANFIEQGADWESLVELNIKGQKVWSEVVEHSKIENSSNPEEEARFNYFNEREFVKDHNLDKKIKEKIINYKKEVFQFLDSSEMKVNYGLTKMSSFDPFFVQVILEFFVKSNNYIQFDKSAVKKNSYFSESVVIERNIFPDDIYDIDYVNEDIAARVQKELRYKSNLIPILTMITGMSGCEHMGLRPEISRTLIQSFVPTLFQEFSKAQFYTMIKNNENNCGSIDTYTSNSAHNVHYTSSSKYLEKVINRYRDLSLFR